MPFLRFGRNMPSPTSHFPLFCHAPCLEIIFFISDSSILNKQTFLDTGYGTGLALSCDVCRCSLSEKTAIMFPQCTSPVPVAPPDHRKVFHESRRHRVHHPLRHVRHAHDPGPGLVLRRARPVKEHPLHVHAQLCLSGDGLHPLGPVRLLPCFQRRYFRPHRQP